MTATQLELPPLVTIPAATFVMGDDARRDDERPAHTVHLPSFRAAVAPVSNREYALFLEATGHRPPPFLHEPRFAPPEQPVVGISWFDAVAYCEWLTAVSDIHFRLPTEAEREYASLGGLEHADWPWQPGDHPLRDWIASLDQPHEPGTACANGYGLRCMAENVHEWCSDWYSPDYYHHSPSDSPSGPPAGTRKASRGGSWRHRIKFTRITARSSIPPEFRYNDYGFRVYATP